MVVVAAAGLIVVSENAQPGDALWGVKSVVFSEQATQTQAMVDVQSNLEQAEAAVAAGEKAGIPFALNARTEFARMQERTRA